MDERDLQSLKRMMNAMRSDNLTAEEFTKAFDLLMERNKEEMVHILDTLVQNLNEYKAELSTLTSEAVQELRDAAKEARETTQALQKTQTTTLGVLRQRAADAVQNLFTRLDIQGKWDALQERLNDKMAQIDNKLQGIVIPEPDPSIKEDIEKLWDAIENLEKKNLGGRQTLVGINPYQPTTILAASGTIDDSNTTFTFAQKPTLVVVNGVSYREDKGWTYTSGNVVLDSAVGTGGDIYGLL